MPRYRAFFAALIATVAILVVPLARPRAHVSPRQSPAIARAISARALPLLFEPAPDSDAAFVARGHGYALRVSDGGMLIRLPVDGATRMVELGFAGGAAPHVVPEARTATHVNYLVGARENWRTSVPAYRRIRLAHVYPGIDAVFYGNQGSVEYDLVVSPGTSPDAIHLKLSGADAIRANGATLTIEAGGATLTEGRVNAYQDVDGRRAAVDARYVVRGDEVRLSVGPYDRGRPLVLDPTITYSTYFGGSGSDAVSAMRTDGGSNLYVAGWAEHGDFPAAALHAHAGAGTSAANDAYVAKFAPDGSVDWLTFVGGTDEDEAMSIDLGGDGDIYIGGATRSADFPTTPGSFHPAAPASGDQDGFVLRLSSDGTTLRYSTCLGAAQPWGGAGAADIRVDTQGRAYIVGQTGSPNFPVTIAASRGAALPGQDNRDAFVAQVSSDGSTLAWSRLLAGSKWETATALTLDQFDNAYVVGSTTSDDFPVVSALFPQKSGPGDQTGSSGHDGFVARLEVSGHVDFATYLGGTGEDDMYAVAQGEFGRIYVGGQTTSDGLAAFPKPSPSGQHSGIVFELAPNGSSEITARYTTGQGNSGIRALTIGRDSSVWMAGDTDGNGWPWVDANPNDTFLQTAYGGGNSDISIEKWSADLSELDYSALFGGSEDDHATAIVSDPLIGDVYFAGQTSSSNYPLLNALEAAPHDANPEGVVDRLACTITELQPVPVQPATGGPDATRSTVDRWCLITGVSDSPWLHITGTSGSAVTFSTDANPTTARRVGHITITGRTIVPITQAPGNGTATGGSVDEIVLNATDAHDVEGRWREVPDSLHGTMLSEPDQGDPKLRSPLARPVNYFEFTFPADANRPYHLWIDGLAENDAYTNDSVWVQFSDTVDGSGNPIWRTDTTNGTFVSLEPCSGCREHGWGWRDNQYGGGLGPNVVFATAGMHTMRIQQREDGFSIGQVTLSAVKYLMAAPGADRNDTTVLQKPSPGPTDDIVLWAAADSPSTNGSWSAINDSTAAGGTALHNPDNGVPKLSAPIASPANYVDISFNADARKPYHLWLRMKADNDFWQNDSVWVQFSGSVDAAGRPTYRIGSANGTLVSLEECSGCGEQGWGWQDNAYGSPDDLGPNIYFAQSGPQTIRIQVREDGLSFDQIVLSAAKYATIAPGASKKDTTILARTQ